MLCQGSLLNIKAPDRAGMWQLTEAGPYAVSTVAGLASNAALQPLLTNAMHPAPLAVQAYICGHTLSLSCLLACSGGGSHCHRAPVSEVLLCVRWQTSDWTCGAQTGYHGLTKRGACQGQAALARPSAYIVIRL